MDFQILITNLTNPTILFFGLGTLAVLIKSDLQIPESSIKFISLYLLFAIGFKGGQELSHSEYSNEILITIIFGLVSSAIVPFYTFYILKRKVGPSDSGAIAAAYGSVSAVTFVSAISFLEMQQIGYGGHMVAVMAFMETPAIIVGVLLIMIYEKSGESKTNFKEAVVHSITNGSVLLILGSLLIGFIADTKQAEGIKPFTNDIFKGFLAIFLLEMGMVTARRLNSFRQKGLYLTLFAILIPLFNGIGTAFISHFITNDIGNRFLLSILSASASYIAVPAAMRIAAPKADPGIYIPMALGITFPINITIGFPLYYLVVANF